MAILIDSVSKNLNPWLKAFKSYDAQVEVYCYDDAVALEKITTAVVWNHRPGLFKQLPNLKLIASNFEVDNLLPSKRMTDNSPKTSFSKN